MKLTGIMVVSFLCCSWYDVLVSLIKGIPLGVVFGVVMNINFTHSWMNAWAELTGFSDRRFYEVRQHVKYMYAYL